MKYLLLLLLPAVAVGGELTTYCTTQYIDAYDRAQTVCVTRPPINTDLEITRRFEQREEQNRETWRRIQEDSDRRARDNEHTRSD